MDPRRSYKKIRSFLFGHAHDPHDPGIFHKLSLIAILAWIGLGVDALSSSSYGPAEAFLALGHHYYLGIIVALFIVFTVFIITASYTQIVELFPHGGGGYVVGSKLLSPTFGMISGCSLIIDYALTITVSIASGTDTVFSFLPPAFHSYKLIFAIACIVLLVYLNLRGVKESILPLVPIFLVFLLTHLFVIGYAIVTHIPILSVVAGRATADFRAAELQYGLIGMILVILHAYSLGAGTFTGIEAVSNGLPVLREPKVRTAKRTMALMAFSLGIMVIGLMAGYILYEVKVDPTKTLNAGLFQQVTAHWAYFGPAFIFIALLSEGTILFVAAQTGFLDGPRVLANMGLDRWLPISFSSLSDRLVAYRGILIMGAAALLLILITGGSVSHLVVLYSITVFITFVLSHLGLVRHWWKSRHKGSWKRKFILSLIGLTLTTFILVTVVILKFHDGGWFVMLLLLCFILIVLGIKRHYTYTGKLVRKLDHIIPYADSDPVGVLGIIPGKRHRFDPKAKTAVFLVSGFNGVGLKTISKAFGLFGTSFRNFIFVEVGVVDAGTFKGRDELQNLKSSVREGLGSYVKLMRRNGYYAKAIALSGVDVAEAIERAAPKIIERFPDAVFFGGQIVYERDILFSRALHNYTVFSLERRLYHRGIPFIILPIKV